MRTEIERNGVLLDTHIWIHLQSGAPLSKDAFRAIHRAASKQSVYVPVISLWEIGMLSMKQRLKFDRPVRQWMEAALDKPGIQLLPLTSEIALEAAVLPKPMHADPADRMILASAIAEGLTLITCDRLMLSYAKSIGLDRIEG